MNRSGAGDDTKVDGKIIEYALVSELSIMNNNNFRLNNPILPKSELKRITFHRYSKKIWGKEDRSLWFICPG